MEQFLTIQGEGLYQGRSAYFIRLGGCDVGCVWCDVKESWDAGKHPLLETEKIIDEMKKSVQKGLVVITGGEPLMHNLDGLTEKLQACGFETSIETSGSHPLSGKWNHICVSPKKFKAPLTDLLDVANELKVVVYNRHDFEWAENHAKLVNKNCKLYLQPEWSKKEEMIPLIVNYIQSNPRWELSLQIHKYINIP